jgi:Tol biopolymer transport system component
MFKKIAIIVLFLGVTFGLGYLLYRFFFSAPTITTPLTNGGSTSTGGLPTAGTGRPTAGTGELPGGLPTSPGTTTPGGTPGTTGPGSTSTIAEGSPSHLKISSGGLLNYYDGSEGKFYRILPNGTKESLNADVFRGASDVTWSPAGDKVALTFPDNSKIIYDFQTQKQVTLPSHWQDITFSGDGSTIVAKSMALDPANRWLISAASDGSSAKLIEPLGQNGDKVTVSVSPDASVVAFSDTADPVGFDTRDLLVIGQNHENFPALRVEGLDFEPNWSPNGGRLLYSAAGQVSDFKPMLWVVDAGSDTVGGSRRSLGINTWADKCVFQGDNTLYCAVPLSLPKGAGLERSIAEDISDSVVKVDLVSGTSSLIGRPDQPTSMSSLVVSPDGSRLYYVDENGSLKEMILR